MALVHSSITGGPLISRDNPSSHVQDDLSSFFTQCPSCVLRVVQVTVAPGAGLGSGQENVVRQHKKKGENVGR